MTVEELTQYWNENFPDFLPVAYELKNRFNARWFRIHALPESKRYPENENEYEEVFKRHNEILSDLFGADRSFILITIGYGFNKDSISDDKKLRNLGFQTNFWMSIDVSDEEDKEKYFWNLFYDELKWKAESLNNLLRLVADDEIREVLIFSIERNFVYHPYDGGADIILKNSARRDKYKEKHKVWLSAHPTGL